MTTQPPSAGGSGKQAAELERARLIERVPDQVIYSLPPPRKTLFPETAAQYRRRLIKAWLPAVLFVTIGGSWYLYAKMHPTTDNLDMETVPDFLKKAMEQRQRAPAGPGAPGTPPKQQ